MWSVQLKATSKSRTFSHNLHSGIVKLYRIVPFKDFINLYSERSAVDGFLAYVYSRWVRCSEITQTCQLIFFANLPFGDIKSRPLDHFWQVRGLRDVLLWWFDDDGRSWITFLNRNLAISRIVRWVFQSHDYAICMLIRRNSLFIWASQSLAFVNSNLPFCFAGWAQMNVGRKLMWKRYSDFEHFANNFFLFISARSCWHAGKSLHLNKLVESNVN